MNRDDKLKQVAAEFGFDPDETIRIGGKYTPVLVDGSTAYIAGQVPRIGEVVHFVGVVGESVSLDDGRRAAGISALRALSLIRKHCGTLDAIATVPRMTVYVRSAPGFTMQSEVADGASDVLVAVLGDAGVHTRSSVGVLQLPKGASVEADFIFGLKRSGTPG
ncbi:MULTISPECIES: RidA family protein [Burkholderia cepacia complex]|uniref:RidA family protein n=1 Tax=Burkholderia cepacia complex TaxID=87882 RepID=UPI00158BD753|nr:RidA family protein [Burkholderia cenocepacia]